MNTLTVNNKALEIKEYNGQRVVTLKDIDTVHNRPDGTARKRFSNNRKRFIEGEDFYKIQKSEKRTLGFDVPNRGLIVMTETGYLMLVKSFTDDLAWAVQRELVNSYFNQRLPEQKPIQQLTDNKPYYVTVSRDPSAYKKLGELKDMATALGTMLDLVGKADTPIKKFVPYLETLQLMAFDFGIEVTKFYKMVDVKDWV